MDEHTLNELLECSVCLDRLDTSSKVLPCQHTFCRRCLDEIVSTKQELRCPECRSLVEIKVEELPSNILLIRLLEGMKTSGGATGSISCTSPSSPRHKSFSVSNRNSNNKFSSSQPCAKALYNYDAKEPGDLSFKKGDVVLLRKQVDENWLHGDLNGQCGFFPATYVQVITALPPQEIPKCTALYDFVIDDENEKDCLTFHKDEVVTVIRRIDEHWAEGKLADRIGIFPISFVDLNDSAKWLINNQPYPQSSLLPGGNSQLNSPVSQAGQSTNSSPVSNDQVSSLVYSTAQTLLPQTTQGRRNDSVPVVTPQNQRQLNNDTASATDNIATTVGILVTTASSNAVSTTAAAVMCSSTLSVNPSTLAVQRPANIQQYKRHSFTSIGQPALSLPVTNQRHSLELPSGHDVVNASMDSTKTSSTSGHISEGTSLAVTGGARAGVGDSQRPVRVASSGIFIALYNYKPQKDDEVELTKGAYYIVSEKCQDGWYKGTCLRTGVVGVFPGNYVQMVRLPASMKTGPSKRGAVRSPANNTNSVTTTTNTTTTATTGGNTNSISSSGLPIDSRLLRSNVNRTHSFPKTSPHHLNVDLHNRSSNQGTVKAPSRTITNVTQALSRCMVSVTTSSSTNSQSQQTPLHTNVVNSSLTTAVHSGDNGSNVMLPVMSSDRSHVCANPGASTHSPKSSRRHHHHHYHHHKYSSRGHSSSRSGHSSPAYEALNTSVGATANRASPSISTADVTADTTGSSIAQYISKPSGSNKPTASSTSAGGTATSSSDKHGKDKKEKRDHHIKRNESLLKRLASAGIPLKGRKSRSPPPPESSNKKENHHSTHHRSGSEGSILEGATAAIVSSSTSSNPHRKSSDKPGKVKPLARDRYRCIVPYPPQSEIELELKVGDVVYVLKKREDGWFKGTLQRTGKTGLFPCSFVERF